MVKSDVGQFEEPFLIVKYHPWAQDLNRLCKQ